MNDRTWAEINLDNIEHNYKAFAAHAKASRVMCVIKANGYGHGSVALGRHLQSCGCDFFGVACLDEAIELAAAGVSAPILVLGYTSPERFWEAAGCENIRLTIFDMVSASKLSQACMEAGRKEKIHVKLDTGMTRIGFNTGEAAAAIKEIRLMENIEIEGLFTHFATADESESAYTKQQFERYMRVATELEEEGISIPIKHVCNSAAAIMFPEMHLDMVRVGISLYGCYPSEEVDKSRIGLKPCMTFKTRIVRVNDVEQSIGLSYGLTFVTKRRSKIATIPVGYADGLSRVTAGKMKVLINGQEAPIAGRICMDQCMVDITDIQGGVSVGDEVEIFGGRLPVERMASAMGTINYEILCLVARRVPRHYFQGETEVGAKNYLI